VLDYGCGTGDWGLFMASEGARVTCLDLSSAAMMVVGRRAKAGGVADRVRTCARDASDLSCFGDGEFDLVYASAAVHHTLKYPNAFAELIRVIRPGGKLILAETYGNNPLLNLARRLRAKAANEPEDAGEEIILSDREIALLRREFREVQVRPMNLLAMGKRFFRGRFTSPMVRTVVGAMEATDAVLLRTAPFLGRYCGEVVVIAQK
jgi:SAM-dependent methyltransferase